MLDKGLYLTTFLKQFLAFSLISLKIETIKIFDRKIPLLVKIFKDRIKGLIGIGSAPEFLEKLMWNKFNRKIKKGILNTKIYNLEHGGYTYPLTKQLFFDGKKNRVLNKKINLKIPISMFHGAKDKSVPIFFSKKILKIFPKAKK